MSALTSSSSLSASFYPTRYVLAFWNAKQSRYLPSSLSFVSMDDALCAFLDGCATRRLKGGKRGCVIISQPDFNFLVWLAHERTGLKRQCVLWTAKEFDFKHKAKWSPFDMQVKCPNGYKRYARLFWLANQSRAQLHSLFKVTFLDRNPPLMASRDKLLRLLYNGDSKTDGWVPHRTELFIDEHVEPTTDARADQNRS